MGTESDRTAIKAIMDLYGFAVDTQRWDLFDQIYTKDVDADWGGTAVWNDLEKFKKDFAEYHDVFDATHHVMTNFICAVDGDRAKSVTYGHWLLIRNAAPGGNSWSGDGWYDDELVRTPDGWRISRRRSGIIRWEGNLNVMSEGVDFSMDTMAMRAAADAGVIGVINAWSL
jgi:hypothetical protein